MQQVLLVLKVWAAILVYRVHKAFKASSEPPALKEQLAELAPKVSKGQLEQAAQRAELALKVRKALPEVAALLAPKVHKVPQGRAALLALRARQAPKGLRVRQVRRDRKGRRQP